MVEARLNLRWPLDAADGGDDPWYTFFVRVGLTGCGKRLYTECGRALLPDTGGDLCTRDWPALLAGVALVAGLDGVLCWLEATLALVGHSP